MRFSQQIQNDLCIDTTRIFATGFSYGAGMSYAIACARANVFRGVALYAGAQLSGCSGGNTPIAYFHAHGVNDSVLSISRGRQLRDHYVMVNGCTAQNPTDPAGGSGTHTLHVVSRVLGRASRALVRARRRPQSNGKGQRSEPELGPWRGLGRSSRSSDSATRPTDEKIETRRPVRRRSRRGSQRQKGSCVALTHQARAFLVEVRDVVNVRALLCSSYRVSGLLGARAVAAEDDQVRSRAVRCGRRGPSA